MYVIKLKKADNTISLRNVRQSITLQQTGRRGLRGDPGEGVPSGGTLGQVLTKQSNVNFDTNWENVPSAPVTSVNGETGAVILDKSDIGLGNVDNTSDANKPISTATQSALDTKADQNDVVLVGGQSPAGTLTFGTTNTQGVRLLIDGNPLMRITSIGNVGFNVGSEPTVPFLVGGGLFTEAGTVFAQINPDSGTDLNIGTTSNHPVNLQANSSTFLTLNTAGTISANSRSIINIQDPSTAQGAATKNYVDTRTGENFRIVAASSTTIADGIASLITNKVEKAGDTMTGGLTIGASTGDVLSLNGTGSNSTILRLRDDGTERGAIFSQNGSSVINFRSQGDLVLIARNAATARSITINDVSATLSTGLDLQVDSSANGLVLRSPNNTRWRVQVSNAGALTVTSI